MVTTEDPKELTLHELRELRSQLQGEDDVVSYVRRVAQARVDLVRAEQHRRERGEQGDGDLPSELRVVLSQHLTGGPPRPPRPDTNISENELSDQLDAVCAEFGFSRIENLTPIELSDLENALTKYERRVSDDRRARFERLDSLSAELVRRYREGEASVDGLFDEI